MSEENQKNIVRQWQDRPDIKSIFWKDLTPLTPYEIFREIFISLPWLLLEFLFLYFGYYFFATLSSFFFFLTGLRQVHGGYHLTLGISKTKTEIFLFFMSMVMLGSMHAVKFNHLCHHKHCMDEMDVEAKSAKMSGVKAILFGPLFPILLYRKALSDSNATYQKWIVAELIMNIVMIACSVVLYVYFQSSILLFHYGLMIVGQCLTSFFAVWTVHHDCKGEIFARTQRGFLKNMISYDMFYHVEHHLFPNVPQCHLHKLAERIDKNAPHLKNTQVF